jgi:hypothetical protein
MFGRFISPLVAGAILLDGFDEASTAESSLFLPFIIETSLFFREGRSGRPENSARGLLKDGSMHSLVKDGMLA